MKWSRQRKRPAVTDAHTSTPASGVWLHSLTMGYGEDDAAANHRAYAERMGYIYRSHTVAASGVCAHVALLLKYSRILQVLRASDERQILVFADDAAVFCASLDVAALLGAGQRWICQDGDKPDRGNGSLMIFRGGGEACRWCKTVLARCQVAEAQSHLMSRWANVELTGEQTCRHDLLLDGRFANLLFPSYGHAMPGARTWAVSFNPTVLPAFQCYEGNRAAMRHISARFEENREPFDFEERPAVTDFRHEFLEGRWSRVAVVLLILPEHESYAALAQDNFELYARRHGYALAIHRWQGPAPANLLAELARLGADQFMGREFVLSCTADCLISGLTKPLPEIFHSQSGVLMRNPYGPWPETVAIGLCNDDAGQAVSRAAREDTNLAQFHACLSDLAGKARLCFSDLSRMAPHPAYRTAQSFLVSYRSLPPNMRPLLMVEDAREAQRKLIPPPSPPASTSFLRSVGLTRLIFGLVLFAFFLEAVRQLR